jgi:hypothetical protein
VNIKRVANDNMSNVLILHWSLKTASVFICCHSELMLSVNCRHGSRKASISGEEIARRSEAEYTTLQAEIIGDLPDFAIGYKATVVFYRSLPWDS